MIPDPLRDIFRAAQRARAATGVSIIEDWRDNNTRLQWNGNIPPEVVALRDYLFAVQQTGSAEDLYVEKSTELRIVRPAIAEHYFGDADSVILFFNPGSLEEAMYSGAGITFRAEFLEKLRKCHKIISPSVDKMFRAGATLYISPLERRARLYVPEAPANVEVQDEDLRRRVTIHEGAGAPCPNLLWPIAPATDCAAAQAVRRMAFAHMVASLSTEILSGNRIIIKAETKIELKLDPQNTNIGYQELCDFSSFFNWINANQDPYTEERIMITRLKIAEALNDVPQWGDGLSEILTRFPKIQADTRETYQAFLKGKIDKYIEDQKKLIENVKSLSDTLSQRTKNLASSLFRDSFLSVVAVLVTIGRILTGSSIGGPQLALLETVLATLAIASGAVHIGIAAFEGHLSRKEFLAWSKRIRDVIPEQRYREIAGEMLEQRIAFFHFSLAAGAAGYIALAAAVYNLHKIIPGI
ncbi:hypothetical protein [Caenispirillum bisanense]|uniref:hypothetical protein n=1 Tax=Caenispirillum bisanense TaxID=414052 RepID=UPI0031DB7F71